MSHLKTTQSAAQTRTKGKVADKATERKPILGPVISYVPTQLSCSPTAIICQKLHYLLLSLLSTLPINIQRYLSLQFRVLYPLLPLSLFLLFSFPSLPFFPSILTPLTLTVPKAQRLPWCMVPGYTSFPSLLQTYRKENDFIQKANKVPLKPQEKVFQTSQATR